MMRTQIHVLLLLVFLAVLVGCNPTKETDAFSPAASFDPVSNRYLAVYIKSRIESYPESHTDLLFRVYGRAISPDGEPAVNELVIAAALSEISSVTIAYDEARARFLVAWINGGRIYETIVDSDGKADGPARTLSASGACSGCLSVAADPDAGMYLALWYERTKSESGIYVQLMDGNGLPTGPKVLVSGNADEDSDPSIAYDGVNQRFLAVWSALGGGSVQGRIINQDGSFPAPEISLYADTGHEFRPAIVYDSVNSRFLAAWEHSDGHVSSLIAEVLNADGTVYQPAFTLSSAGRSVGGHALAYDPADQEYLAVLADSAAVTIYGQPVTAQGGPDTVGNVLLSYRDFPGDHEPALAYDSANRRYLAVWTYGLPDDHASGSADIHGRIVNADGTPAGDISIISNGGSW